MTKIEFPRFKKEIVPFDIAIQKPWIQSCEPDLLPAVAKDLRDISAIRIYENTPAMPREKKLYIATAGGPCSGKSTELDLELSNRETDYRYNNIVIIDPDRYTMDYMNHTYRPMLSAGKKAELGAEEAARQAYERARPGSNIIANVMFNQAFDGGYHIAHGTTMTSPFIGGMLDNLGKEGYYRRLLLCSSPLETREAAGTKRIEKESHYQVNPDDFKDKRWLYPQRMADYFTHGDHLKLLWKPDVEQTATLAAEFKDGKKIIHNPDAFIAFVAHYEADRHVLEVMEKPVNLPAWDKIESLYLNRHWEVKQSNDNQPPRNDKPSSFGFQW